MEYFINSILSPLFIVVIQHNQCKENHFLVNLIRSIVQRSSINYVKQVVWMFKVSEPKMTISVNCFPKKCSNFDCINEFALPNILKNFTYFKNET